MGATGKLNRALAVVDVQRDFCPGGALATDHGDLIVPALNRYLAEARAQGITVYASRDWHPPKTRHFKPYGGPWPPHCVQGTPGADFHPDLALPPDAILITKGDGPDEDAYSAFDGHTPSGKTLLDDLRERQIDRLYVAGLTAEYCVKQTALDARRAGLRVIVLTDAVGGIEAHPGDTDRAFAEMADAGAELARTLADRT